MGQRVCLFSFGSGLAASMFSLTVKKGLPPKRTGAKNGGVDLVKGTRAAKNGLCSNGVSNDIKSKMCNGVSPNKQSSGVANECFDTDSIEYEENRTVTGLDLLVESFKDLDKRLDARTKISPKEFTDMLASRENDKFKSEYTCLLNLMQLWLLFGIHLISYKF